MSWIGAIAGRAEELLNKVDKTAASALKSEEEENAGQVKSRISAVGETPQPPVGGFSPYPTNSAFSTSTPTSSSLMASSSVPSNLNKMNNLESQSTMTRSMYSTSNFSTQSKSKSRPEDDLFDFLNSSDPVEPKKKVPVRVLGNNGKHSRQSSTSSTTSARSSKTPDPSISAMDISAAEQTDVLDNEPKSETPPPSVMERGDIRGSESSSEYHNNHPEINPNQDQKLSALQLENSLLKNEVSSLNQEMASVIKRAKESQDELYQFKKQHQEANRHLSKSDQIVRELRAREGDLQETINAKDSQLAILRVRFEETEKELQGKKKVMNELQTERDRILQDHTSATDVQGQAFDSLKQKLNESEKALISEKEAHRKSQQEANERLSRLEAEQKKMAEELASMQKKVTEERVRYTEVSTQAATAKAQVESAKLELTNYKEKATRILQSKDKLIASLKDGSGASGPDNIVANMELDNLKQEREMLREELQNAQATIEHLRLELNETEVQMSQDNEASQDTIQSLEEQLKSEKGHKEAAEVELAKQKQELRFAHEELLKQKTNLQSRINDRETEIDRLRQQLTAKSNSNSSQMELENRLHALTESLIQKQTMLESLSTEKNSLSLQLERMDKLYREAEASAVRSSVATVVMNDDDEVRQRLPTFMRESPMDGDVARKVKRAANTIDKFSIRLGVFLRRYPIARVFVIMYMVLLHVWVMVVLLTYQPEMHGHDYSPMAP